MYLLRLSYSLRPCSTAINDRGEVVVGQDHAAGVLGYLSATAHGYAYVGGLDRGRVVDAVARHGDDITLFLERLGQQYLVLRCDTAHHADDVDPLQAFGLGQGGEIGAQDRLAPVCRAAWR